MNAQQAADDAETFAYWAPRKVYEEAMISLIDCLACLQRSIVDGHFERAARDQRSFARKWIYVLEAVKLNEREGNRIRAGWRREMKQLRKVASGTGHAK